MLQKSLIAAHDDAYGHVGFSDRFKRLGGPASQTVWEARPATIEEALASLDGERHAIAALAPNSVVAKVMAHNPDIFQIISGPGSEKRDPAFVAFLPLNEIGAERVVSGHFAASNPDLAMICKEGEPVAAIYIWLLVARGGFVKAIRAMRPVLGRLAPKGCPIYARAAASRASALLSAAGFAPAQLGYPEAPGDLLVVAPPPDFPVCEDNQTRRISQIHVKIARTLADMLHGFSIRAATYIADQQCPFGEEFDGNDFCATHFIGYIGEEPAGCIRVRFFAGFVKLERLAVRREYRTSKLAFRLVREALTYARRKGYRRAYGHSRTDLTRFWGLFGFVPVGGRPSFIFSDVEYVELEVSLDESADTITVGSDPYILIRPEGDWDRPGPLDQSILRSKRPARASHDASMEAAHSALRRQ